jgi:hypothetical protein
LGTEQTKGTRHYTVEIANGLGWHPDAYGRKDLGLEVMMANAINVALNV